MKFKFIKKEVEEPEVIVYAKESNIVIESIEKLCSQGLNKLYGYLDNNRFEELHVNEIECFIADNNKVFALNNKNKYTVKYKLYEIYELFNDNFIYINQSCLINVSKIKFFDVNFGGALKVILKSGYSDYVSRRQVKNVKERLGIINEKNSK